MEQIKQRTEPSDATAHDDSYVDFAEAERITGYTRGSFRDARVRKRLRLDLYETITGGKRFKRSQVVRLIKPEPVEVVED